MASELKEQLEAALHYAKRSVYFRDMLQRRISLAVPMIRRAMVDHREGKNIESALLEVIDVLEGLVAENQPQE